MKAVRSPRVQLQVAPHSDESGAAGSNASESLSPNLGGDEAGFSLSLSPDSAYGTTITSTRALWYGNVTARIRTTPTASTVTGFSLVDGAQGEINFE